MNHNKDENYYRVCYNQFAIVSTILSANQGIIINQWPDIGNPIKLLFTKQLQNHEDS